MTQSSGTNRTAPLPSGGAFSRPAQADADQRQLPQVERIAIIGQKRRDDPDRHAAAMRQPGGLVMPWL